MFARAVAQPKVFDVKSITEIGTIFPGRIRTLEGIPPTEVAIPEIQFGQVAVPAFSCREWLPNNWFEKSYSIHDGFTYEIHDAIVHADLGMIAVDDFLIRESLHFVFPRAHGFGPDNPDRLTIPNANPDSRLDLATHALCGYVGNKNYAHWWVNIVPAVGHGLGINSSPESIFLFPPLRAAYQRECLELIPEISDRTYFIPVGASVRCDVLLFTPRILACDYTPHPQRMAFIETIKRRAGANNNATRRIYLSRRDAPGRPLVNSGEVEDVMKKSGFEVVTTKDMSVREQICLFSKARQVVSPHGAGLANILFCAPDTTLLEFHYDTNINWSLRRLASIIPMKYGCLVGRETPPPEHDHNPNASWHLSIQELENALSQMGS